MRAALDEYRATFFPLTVQRLTDSILESYGQVSVASIAETAEKARLNTADEVKAVQTELEEVQKALTHLTELESTVESARDDIEELSERYGQTDPDDLIQPFRADPVEIAEEAVTEVEASAHEAPESETAEEEEQTSQA